MRALWKVIFNWVPALSLTKIQDLPEPPWKYFQDLFGAGEC